MLRENPSVTKEQVEQIVMSLRGDCAFADEVRLARTGSLFSHTGDAPLDADAIVMETHAEEYRGELARNQIDSVQSEVHRRAAAVGLEIEPGSLDERLIGRAILKEYIRSCEEAASDAWERLACLHPASFADESETSSTTVEPQRPSLDPVVASAPLAPSLPAENSPLVEGAEEPEETEETEENPRLKKLAAKIALARNLNPNTPWSETWNLFLEDRRKFDRIKERPSKLTSSLNLWQAVHGDHPACTWTEKQAEELRRVFVLLPAKYRQAAKWKKLGNLRMIAAAFQDEVEHVQTLEEKQALLATGTKDKTWNRHNSTLRQFWPWAIRNGLVPKEAPNPFESLHIELDEDAEPWEGGSQLRLMWEEPPLRQLLNSPIFLGCKSASERYLPGNLVIRDVLYWGVVILAHTGMRREELCQLQRKHVCFDEEAGIWYFNLKAKGLRLKEKASKRWVPIPDNLLRLGIVAALFEGRGTEELLFPVLYPSAADRAYGTKLGKMFSYYRKAYDEYCEANASDGDFTRIYRPLMDLHSFRTTVATNLIRRGVPQAHAEEVTGHKSKARKTAFENYDRGATLKILKDALDKLILPVDIEALVSAAAHAQN